MKLRPFLTAILFSPLFCPAQPVGNETHQLMKINDGFYHLFYDSSTAKSTIIEFDKFVALIEVPIRNEGGGATNLKDHSFGGLKVIATIKKHFPKKPLKYVLHSHWHPHSLSSVKPFLAAGAKLVSTRTNFERIKTFVDTVTLAKYEKQIQFVDGDSLVIKDRSNKIVAYRFLQREYPSTPATEYLYFYFPKYFALHSGCMYTQYSGAAVDGQMVITDRQKDLNQFIQNKKLDVRNFVRISGDRHVPECILKGEDFRNEISNGITSRQISERYLSASTSILNEKQDSIVHLITSKKIPLSLINTNVYASLRDRDFERALAFAKLQVLVNPSDVNAWDTLGEVNFFIGNRALAQKYHGQSLKVDPTFTAGGESAWEKSLNKYEAIWQNLKK